MNHKNNRRKAFWIIIFVLVVSISGLALAASGNLENPLAVFSTSGAGGQRGTPPATMVSAADTSSDVTPLAENTTTAAGGTATAAADSNMMAERGGEDQSSVNWSSIGSVLYNTWFLFAITAIVVVIQTLTGQIMQRLKPRIPKAAKAS